MIKVSKLADYAVVVLHALAAEPARLMSAAALAQQTQVPEPTVAKILKTLANAGIVQSVRGAQGGYRLAQRAENVSIAAVVRAIDGPIAVTGCVDESAEPCNLNHICALKGRWGNVNSAITVALENVKLSDMSHGRH
ncbi:MAG: SUF system Fe-S cluster assembly regulator [Alphaproteobacteria bacterium]|nr:SUF system Fe-S cluster assembly regulator [Alphaproteobacteria bacterium]